MPQVAVRLFGYPCIEIDSALVPVERLRTLALLVYLATTGERIGRDHLAALLWPGYDREQARAYLRHSLWELRRALGEESLILDRQTARLDHDRVWVDVVCFRQQLSRCQSSTGQAQDDMRLLAEATDLYRGDFLAGFSLAEAEEFDDWQLLEAESLRREFIEALFRLSQLTLAHGEHDRAMAVSLRWLQADPLDERAHRAAMSVYASLGQRALALRQYQLCAETLKRELDVKPEPATQALYQQILAASPAPAPAVPVSPPPPKKLFPLPDLPGTPLVGRETEMAELAHLIADPECHLLTLAGAGGVGKTRLALEAAHVLQERFDDGVLVVSLADIQSPEHVSGAIARAIGIPEPSPGSSGAGNNYASRLLEYLREREMLLVLDNMEHLLPAAPFLERLAFSAPTVKVLITSRERLNLASEWVLPINGLPCPPNAAEPEHYAAARLFLSGARRSKANFRPSSGDWTAIVRICRALDGLPLGLEMAASWVRLLSPAEIAAELERNLDFLSGTWRGAPERHRSMRAVFEQSWALLPPAERQALARLSVFRGGFTDKDAAAVVGTDMSLLVALADRSLLERRSDGRYQLHVAISQYATEKLSLTPAYERQVRDKHCFYYLEKLAGVGAGLMASGEEKFLAMLEKEALDSKVAWQQAIKEGHWEPVCAAAPAWALFHEMRGRREEGLWLFEAAIEPVRKEWNRHPGPGLASLLALLLAVTWRFSRATSSTRKADAMAVESQRLTRELPDNKEVAYALVLLSIGGGLSVEESLSACRRSQDIFSRIGDRWGEALARLVWADGANFSARDYEVAQKEYEKALAIFSDLGNNWGRALCYNGMALIAMHRQRYDDVAPLGSISLAIYEQLGDLWRVCEMRELMARAAWAGGNGKVAEQHLEACVTALERAGFPVTVARIMGHAARLAAQHGDRARAEGWLTRSLERWQELGEHREQEETARALEQLRAAGSFFA